MIACIFSVTFFVNDLGTDLSPTFWCEVLQLHNFTEDYPDFLFRFVTAVFYCSARVLLLSFAFPVLSVDGILILDFCKFWDGVVLARIIFVISNCVVFFTFMQIFKKYRKYVCDSLPFLDGFSFFIFDFGDEDSLLR